MPRRSVFRTAGWALVVLGIVGFLIVADDLRHSGELAGVAAIVASGLAFLGSASHWLSHRVALEWLPAGIVVGLVVGFATDQMALWTASGFAGGLVLAYLRCAARRDFEKNRR